jgi:hypothetical protein
MNAHKQGGLAALGIVLMLASLLTVAVLYAHRGLLLEQRGAVNQVDSAQALAAADAGLEWAATRLGDPRAIDGACLADVHGTSFPERHVPQEVGLVVLPATAGAPPGCRLAGDALVCGCDGPPVAPADASADAGPAFRLTFEAIDAVTDGVRVTSHGCVGWAANCSPDTANDTAAAARASIEFRFKPGLMALPSAAITAGGRVELGGHVTVTNQDARHGSLLVNAGSTISVAGSATMTGPDGTPAASLLAPNDASLKLDDGGALFVALFGTTRDRHSRASAVARITGASPRERGEALRHAHAAGYSAFAVEGDLLFDATEIGSAERPVLVVTSDRLSCAGPCRLHGLVYGDQAVSPAAHLQNITVQGALVTRGDHVQGGHGGVMYDAEVLEALRLRTGTFIRVPGTWRDF